MAKKQVKEDRKKHFKVKTHELYKIDNGQITQRPELCPRCKKYIAHAKNRKFCGGCGWTEFSENRQSLKGQKTVEKPEEPKTEDKPAQKEETSSENEKSPETGD